MNLSNEDESWLRSFQHALEIKFPGLVREIIIFGSKARGTANADSDLDILVIIREGDWRTKQAVEQCGYADALTDSIGPSIIVRTDAEWGWRRETQSPFWRTVTRDAVALN